MLVCAKDGWVDDWSGEVPKKWNFLGCVKYQRTPIYCLSRSGRVQIAKPRMPDMSWLKKTAWRIVNSSKEVEIDFSESDSVSFETFKNCLVGALKADDDLLSQNQDKGVLVERVYSASEYSELRALYHESGWV